MTNNNQRWILAVVALAKAVQVARFQVLVVLARPVLRVLRVLPVLRQQAVGIPVVEVVVAVIHIRKSGFL